MTQIMPRPDLRIDWRPRHARTSYLAWARAELASKPWLLGVIIALGGLAFVAPALFTPPTPVAGPRPTATPSPSRPTTSAPPVVAL